jgi:hypothetical protein
MLYIITSYNIMQHVGAGRCACLKNCACTTATCWCASDADKTPVGTDAFFTKKGLAWGGNKADKKGKCACACGGVLGA